MMAKLGTAAVSTGSACATGLGTASHVLLSAGLTIDQAAGTIRFSLGRKTTQAELDQVGGGIIEYCNENSLNGKRATELSNELVSEAE